MAFPKLTFDLPYIRALLYIVLGIFSFIIFCCCCSRLHYTTHIPHGDPLNGGRNFYDPIIVELLVTCLFTIPWSIFVVHTILGRHERRYGTTVAAEVVGLAILFLFWIVGVSVATNIWGNLAFCQQYHACQLLTAIVAFAWLSWLLVLLLLILSILFGLANRAWAEPLHGRWDPRTSHYRSSYPQTSERA